MISSLARMAALLNEMEAASETVEAAIERTEYDLKLLRTIKAGLAIKSGKEPKPRTKKEKVTA